MVSSMGMGMVHHKMVLMVKMASGMEHHKEVMTRMDNGLDMGKDKVKEIGEGPTGGLATDVMAVWTINVVQATS